MIYTKSQHKSFDKSKHLLVYTVQNYAGHINTVNIYLLICWNSLSKIRWINEFGGLNGYTSLIVDYIDNGKLWLIEMFGGSSIGRYTMYSVFYTCVQSSNTAKLC